MTDDNNKHPADSAMHEAQLKAMFDIAGAEQDSQANVAKTTTHKHPSKKLPVEGRVQNFGGVDESPIQFNADGTFATIDTNMALHTLEVGMAKAGECNCNSNACGGACGVNRPVGEAMKAFSRALVPDASDFHIVEFLDPDFKAALEEALKRDPDLETAINGIAEERKEKFERITEKMEGLMRGSRGEERSFADLSVDERKDAIAFLQKELTDGNPAMYNGFKRAFDLMTEPTPFLFTGTLCPELAPCMGGTDGKSGCTRGINDPGDAVKIRDVEAVIEMVGWLMNWFDDKFKQPSGEAQEQNGHRSVAIVGAGPAGFASAVELRKQGYDVTIYDKDERPGGLMANGIPGFKYPKDKLNPYIAEMQEMGIKFEMEKTVVQERTGANAYLPNRITIDEIKAELGEGNKAANGKERNVAVIAAPGVTANPRPMTGTVVRGSVDESGKLTVDTEHPLSLKPEDIRNIHEGMDYLTAQNDADHKGKDTKSAMDFGNKRVLVVGAGDTASDVIGTMIRQRNQGKYDGDDVPALVRFDRNVEPEEMNAEITKRRDFRDRLRSSTRSSSEKEFDELIKENKMEMHADKEMYATVVKHVVVDKDDKLLGVMYEEREVLDQKIREKAAHPKDNAYKVVGEGFLPLDEIVKATGYLDKSNPLLTELGIQDNNGKTHVKNTRSETMVDTYVAGDADPGSKGWLVVHAMQSGLTAAWAKIVGDKWVDGQAKNNNPDGKAEKDIREAGWDHIVENLSANKTEARGEKHATYTGAVLNAPDGSGIIQIRG